MVVKQIKQGYEVDKLLKVESDLLELLEFKLHYRSYLRRPTHDSYFTLTLEIKERDLKQKHNYSNFCKDCLEIITYLNNEGLKYHMYKMYGGWNYTIRLKD